MILKVIYVGLGNISDVWLPYLLSRNDIEISALVDINDIHAKKQAQKYNINCPIFTNIDKAIDKIPCDIVIDNAIPSQRLSIAQSALSNKLHVISEKPLASSIQDALNINKLSEQYNKNFFVMQNRRYNTNMFSFKNAIQSKVYGNIGYLSADFFLGPHFGGFRDLMDSPLLIDMAIHTFDQARFLLGVNPISVYCHEYNPSWSWYKGNANALCIFEFENDIVFKYTGSWCVNGTNTSWDSEWKAYFEKGSILWDGTSSLQSDTQLETIECNLSGHIGCINEMINAIKNKKIATTNSFDNIYSLAMVFASIKSAKLNEKIYINDIIGG